MTKKLLTSLVALSMVVSFVGFGQLAIVKADTLISDCDDLLDIANDLNGDYRLTNDIDCSGVAEFPPLGDFTGTLDGRNFHISDITITLGNNIVGMFNRLDGATVKNLTIEDSSVIGNYECGILAATAENSFISNVHVQGTLRSTAALSEAGGLVGFASNTDIYASSADVDVTSFSESGVLVGILGDGSKISRSYAVGSVFAFDGGEDYALNGGLVGLNDDSTIEHSFAVSNLSVSLERAGGLVGENRGNSSITKSYAAGYVNAPDGVFEIGGLIGEQTGGAENSGSYYNRETALDGFDSLYGTSITTAQMKTESTFVGWDFVDTWEMNPDDYPHLQPYDVATPVFTEVDPLPSDVYADNAIYSFSMNKPGSLASEPCDANVDIDEESGTITYTDLVVGQFYDECDFFFVDFGGIESNTLTLAAFTVLDFPRSGSVRKKKVTPNIPDAPITIMPIPTTLPDYIETTFSAPGDWFPRSLRMGSRGADVKLLQQWLNSKGYKISETGAGSPGQETDYFGPKTRAAVIRYQKANSITPAVGFVGPITRASIMK